MLLGTWTNRSGTWEIEDGDTDLFGWRPLVIDA